MSLVIADLVVERPILTSAGIERHRDCECEVCERSGMSVSRKQFCERRNLRQRLKMYEDRYVFYCSTGS